MKRPWQVWSIFGLCLALVLPAMIWLTWRAVQLDCAEARAQREAELEESVGSALWQMDAELTRRLAPDIARPSFFYRPFYAGGGKRASIPSPLLVQPAPHVRLHFELRPDNSWSSPQCPSKDEQRLAVANAVPVERIEHSRRLLEELSQKVRYEQVLTRLPQAVLPLPVQPVGPAGDNIALANPDQQGKFVANLLDSPAVQQQLELSQTVDSPGQADNPPQLAQGQPGQESPSQMRSQRANVRRGSELSNRNELLQNAVQQSAVAQRQNLDPTPAPSPAVEGISQPLWVDSQLLLARRVESAGTTLIQGCWLDWPRIKQELLDSIRPLLPDADLQPVTDVAGVRVARVLVTLPVQLVVPPPAVTVDPYSPMRLSLMVAWLFMTLATVSFAVLLKGVVTLSERRAAFVSAVTHELRTPLTTFRMYAEMLAAGMVTDAAQRQTYLDTLQVEADRLSHLVENVLQYARLERGAGGKRREAVGLGDFLDRTERRLADRCAQAEMELCVEASEAVRTLTLQTDPAAVEQILFNLVDNACKYAAGATERQIHVELEARRDTIKIRVRDHGPGITGPEARRLFRPFSKSARDAANSAPGVGLGLALCRRLAVDLGGWLEVESNVAGGAFALTLPRRA